MIAIIDYGMGNLRSVQKAFEKFCPDVIVSSSAKDILMADKIIVPGVGAFDVAMDELKKRDLIGPIKTFAERGKPLVGICLGLQLLFSESEEGGQVKGLDIIKGRVKRFKEKRGLKIPHMGWNRIRTATKGIQSRSTGSRCLEWGRAKSKHEAEGRTTILDGVEDGSYMYFVHSYYAEPEDKEVILCETDYGGKFASGVRQNNVYGFQFHPEKSQSAGLKIVENFAKLC